MRELSSLFWSKKVTGHELFQSLWLAMKILDSKYNVFTIWLYWMPPWVDRTLNVSVVRSIADDHLHPVYGRLSSDRIAGKFDISSSKYCRCQIHSEDWVCIEQRTPTGLLNCPLTVIPCGTTKFITILDISAIANNILLRPRLSLNILIDQSINGMCIAIAKMQLQYIVGSAYSFIAEVSLPNNDLTFVMQATTARSVLLCNFFELLLPEAIYGIHHFKFTEAALLSPSFLVVSACSLTSSSAHTAF